MIARSDCSMKFGFIESFEFQRIFKQYGKFVQKRDVHASYYQKS